MKTEGVKGFFFESNYFRMQKTKRNCVKHYCFQSVFDTILIQLTTPCIMKHTRKMDATTPLTIQ